MGVKDEFKKEKDKLTEYERLHILALMEIINKLNG